MKKLKQFLATLIILSCSNGFAQENYRKAEVLNKIKIEGNIDAIWTFLSNLSNLEKLVPSTIEKSTLVGNGRGSIVSLKLTNNKGIIVEEVVKLDNKKRIISYSMISTPLPIKGYLATFEINELNEKSFEVHFIANFKVQDQNRKARIDAFNALQLELLNNLKKLNDEIQQ